MACGERNEAPVGIRIELDEDQIPDLDTFGAPFVHKRTLRVASWSQIDMEF